MFVLSLMVEKTFLYNIYNSFLIFIIFDSKVLNGFKYCYITKTIWYQSFLSAQLIGHHHHVVPLARISMTLSRHFFLSFIASGWSSGLHPVSSYSCCMYVRAGRPAFARPYAGVHRSTSLISSSLLLQQCLFRLTWIVFVMGEGRWPYSWYLVGCYRQDCSILLAPFLCNCRLASSPAV